MLVSSVDNLWNLASGPLGGACHWLLWLSAHFPSSFPEEMLQWPDETWISHVWVCGSSSPSCPCASLFSVLSLWRVLKGMLWYRENIFIFIRSWRGCLGSTVACTFIGKTLCPHFEASLANSRIIRKILLSNLIFITYNIYWSFPYIVWVFTYFHLNHMTIPRDSFFIILIKNKLFDGLLLYLAGKKYLKALPICDNLLDLCLIIPMGKLTKWKLYSWRRINDLDSTHQMDLWETSDRIELCGGKR